MNNYQFNLKPTESVGCRSNYNYQVKISLNHFVIDDLRELCGLKDLLNQVVICNKDNKSILITTGQKPAITDENRFNITTWIKMGKRSL